MTSLYAILEYDDCTLYSADGAPGPFESGTNGTQCIDLTEWERLCDGKHYAFIAAISGHRSDYKRPLYPLRGMPKNVAPRTARFFEDHFGPDFQGVGWL